MKSYSNDIVVAEDVQSRLDALEQRINAKIHDEITSFYENLIGAIGVMSIVVLIAINY
jgi:hypothetical protein